MKSPVRWPVVLGVAILILTTALPGAASAQRSAAGSAVAAPVFAFPSNGTVYPSSGAYLFQVQPVIGATGYLWSFVQNGRVVYQNLAWDGHLSPASYTVAPSSKAHALIQPGELTVWVRALMSTGQWSASATLGVSIQGTGTTLPKPGLPKAGVLYQAGVSGGFAKWKGTPDWKYLNGQLLNDGTATALGFITAPYTPTTTDYAVEAQIQTINCSSIGQGFGIVIRAAPDGQGYFGNLDCGGHGASLFGGTLASHADIAPAKSATIDTKWHTFRMEARGNNIRYLIDNILIAEATDNRYLSSGQVGLYDSHVQINVRSFKVLKL